MHRLYHHNTPGKVMHDRPEQDFLRILPIAWGLSNLHYSPCAEVNPTDERLQGLGDMQQHDRVDLVAEIVLPDGLCGQALQGHLGQCLCEPLVMKMISGEPLPAAGPHLTPADP